MEFGVSRAQFALFDGSEIQVAHVGGPQTAALRFPFASVTKLFTATVALQLVGDGDVELDAPLGRYGEEFAAAPNGLGAVVTARHLLSHTGGLVCDLDDGELSPRGYAAAAGKPALLFPPGSAFSYSNTGFALAGRLIESVTGTPWREAMDSFLLHPLGITPAYVPGPGPSVPGPAIASGHAVTAAGAVPLEPRVPAALAPAAALAGTAEDLVAFARLHTEARDRALGALLDDDGVAQMRRPVPGAEPYGLADGWGLGWARYGRGDRPWLGLDAMGAGTTCNLRVRPRDGTVLALVTDSTAGLALWRGLTDRLRAEGTDVGPAPAPEAAPEARPRPAAVPAAAGDRVGTWVNGTLEYRVTGGEAGAPLHLEDDTGARYRLDVDGHGVFRAHRTDIPEAPYAGRFLSRPDPANGSLMQFAGRVLRKEMP
ncbi:serine hydrolase [Streptomyces sp. NBRC 110028]|uniref:serine hydrolase domain-containing protein n=1 Tax=Streptomyces sp. NBRC 110028 TaxID=1621260 RepID=UPI0006E3D950|nr:serine hydrolase domain-containing protein [Streptomyces sp. NBRC 110028]